MSILILSSPFSTSRVYFGEKSTPHTILTFTIFFTFRYYWFQKPIPTYDSVMLGLLCLFRSFSDPTHKILSVDERCAPFFVCFTSYLSWLKALILPQVSKLFSPPPPFFLFVSSFAPFSFPFSFPPFFLQLPSLLQILGTWIRNTRIDKKISQASGDLRTICKLLIPWQWGEVS